MQGNGTNGTDRTHGTDRIWTGGNERGWKPRVVNLESTRFRERLVGCLGDGEFDGFVGLAGVAELVKRIADFKMQSADLKKWGRQDGEWDG